MGNIVIYLCYSIDYLYICVLKCNKCEGKVMRLLNKYKVYLFAFILPILLYFLILFLKDIYPFGQMANIAYDENC